jgi:LysR family transcriptional regulator, hydrogen peroxide-inducible genes activator
MNLPQIKYFLAVCQVGGFGRAAAICGISQPSLSAAIRRLEGELGGRLFERGPPVRLSPLGEAVKPHFKAILREIDKIHRLRVLASEGAAHSGNGQEPQADSCHAFTSTMER